MQTIPLYVYEQIKLSLDEAFKDKLLSFLAEDVDDDSKEEWLDHYIRDILVNQFGYERDEVVDPREVRVSAYRRRQGNKKYWLKRFKEELAKTDNPVMQEIESWKMVAEQLKLNNPQLDIRAEEERLFGVKNIKDLPKIRLKQIEQWAKDSATKLTDYQYLKQKRKSTIDRAFQTDIIVEIGDIIIEHFDGDIFNTISNPPYDLVNAPLFSQRETKMKTYWEVDQQTNAKMVYNDYQVSDEYLLRTVIRLDDDEQVTYDSSVFKTLDAMDKMIIEYVLLNKSESFYTDRTITIDISTLVSKLYSSRGIKNYQAIEQRLQKIRSFAFQAIIKKERKNGRAGSFAYPIFEAVLINTDEKGRRYAEITIGTHYYQQIINNQTVKIYSHLLGKLEKNISKILIHALQKERLDRYIQGKAFVGQFGYTYFASKIRFETRKIATNMAAIEESLQEFKDLNILIRSYKRKPQSFEIEFMPLSHAEIHDFFEVENDAHVQMALPIAEE